VIRGWIVHIVVFIRRELKRAENPQNQSRMWCVVSMRNQYVEHVFIICVEPMIESDMIWARVYELWFWEFISSFMKPQNNILKSIESH
jgi:hypothetical protein